MPKEMFCYFNVLWIWRVFSGPSFVSGFSLNSIHQRNPFLESSRMLHRRTLNRMTALQDTSSDYVDNIIDEIEIMKKDALQKLNALDEKISRKKDTPPPVPEKSTVASPLPKLKPIPIENEESESDYMDRRLGERMAVSNDPGLLNKVTTTRGRKRDEALLDGTQWKLSLDIGREPGTWMPKDWGVSGARLKLDFDFEFTDRQLYEREDFLGSMGDAKIVSVKDSKMVLSPSLTEGTRQIPVKNGGWRVSKGKGPMGSDLLRFYVEISEEVSRTNGDVYCPAGRIYCSCGFFNMDRPSSGEKARYKKKLDQLMNRAEALDDEIATAGFLDKFKKNAEMIKLKVELQETAERYRGASVMEPDTSILRFSPEGDVGLTKEGGVCCKVSKGMAIEYHILGRFYIQGKRNN